MDQHVLQLLKEKFITKRVVRNKFVINPCFLALVMTIN